MKKWFLILVILFITVSTSGCWNYKELNELAIVTGIAIDKKGDDYAINLLISNAKKQQSSASEGQAQTVVYEGIGPTLSEAMSDIDLETPKKIYLGHIAIVVISEEIASEGINAIIDLLMRDPESRKKFYFILAKEEKAGNILKVLSPLESFPSQNITVNIRNSSEVQATTTDTLLSKFVAKLMKKGINPVLSTITIKGDPELGKSEDNLKETTPKTILKLDNLGLFKKDKLVGFANIPQSEGINILNNRINTMIVKAKCEETSLVADITKLETKNKVIFTNGKPSIDVTVKVSGAIKEVNCQKNLEDPNVITEIEKMIKSEIEKLIKEALELAQKEYKTDIFGYGNLIYQKNPNYFKKIEPSWDDHFFPLLEVKPHVILELKSKGSLEQTIKEKDS